MDDHAERVNKQKKKNNLSEVKRKNSNRIRKYSPLTFLSILRSEMSFAWNLLYAEFNTCAIVSKRIEENSETLLLDELYVFV